MIREIDIVLPDGSHVIYKGESTEINFETGVLEFQAIPVWAGGDVPILGVTKGREKGMIKKLYILTATILALCFFSYTASAQTLRMVLKRLQNIEEIIDELDSNQKTELESLKNQISEISSDDISAVAEANKILQLQVEKLEQEIERISAATA